MPYDGKANGASSAGARDRRALEEAVRVVFLGQTAVASRLGVAGSLVVIVIWIYCESYIVLFGAELTAVYSSRYRRHRAKPESGATSAGADTSRDVA